MGVSLVAAQLGGIIAETCLCGVFILLEVATLYILCRRRDDSSGGANTFMTAASALLFVLIVMHWIVDVLRIFDAFIVHFAMPGGPLGYYANLSDTKNILKTSLMVTEVIVGDSVIIYRLFTVWGRNKLVIAFPLFCLVGFTVCGVGVTYVFSIFVPEDNIFSRTSGRFITGLLSFTLIINIYSSSMISYRIWDSNRLSATLGPSSFTPVIMIVMESAAIYTLGTFITFILYLAHSNAQYASLDATSPLIGIAFCLIIVRIELQRRKRSSRLDEEPTFSTHLDFVPQTGFPMHTIPEVRNSRSAHGHEEYDSEDDKKAPSITATRSSIQSEASERV